MEPFAKSNREAFVNFLHARYAMYTGALHVESRPYHLSIDPSDKCQLRCPTCPTGIENEGRRRGREGLQVFRSNRAKLDPAMFEAVISELGPCLFSVLFYNYGEPLLNRRLPAYVRRAKSYEIDTEVHSNLSLPLDDEFIDELLASGLNRLLASVDGFSQETYEMHRVGGDLDLVRRNLERLVAARDRLRATTRITFGLLRFSFNEHEIGAARAYCDRLGIEFYCREAFIDDPAWLPAHRRDETPWRVPREAILKPDAPLGWSPLPRLEPDRGPSACGWHYGYSIITAAGRVAPCCAVAREEYDLGQIAPGEAGFGDIWNNERYRRSRAAFAGQPASESRGEPTICVRCPYPRSIHHLYSIHDARILIRFHDLFAGSGDPLEEAFELFSRCRYGLPLAELAMAGGAPDPDRLFVGAEDERQTAGFVRFFGEFLRPAAASG